METINYLIASLPDLYRMVKINLCFSNKMNVLNIALSDSSNNATASDVAALLQRMILRLKGKYLAEDGKSVDYQGFRNDDLFREFESSVGQLNNVDLSELNEAQLKSFFINVYNILTIHGLCKCDPMPSSVTDVGNFWKSTAYVINQLEFSLDDIEHGILRGNKRHPSALSPTFSETDPRRKFSMKECDPRIHFVLNCGAKSCPAVSVYKETNLENSLNNAARNFVNDNFRIDGNNLHVSKLFMWYGSDFGENNKEILRWMCPYLSEPSAETVRNLLESGKFEIKYEPYDWLINTQ